MLTDHVGVILLILRVVTNAEGEATQKIGSQYNLPQASPSLPDCFDQLSELITDEMAPAALKKLVKEKMPTFSGPMASHLADLAASSGPRAAIEALKSSVLTLCGHATGYLCYEDLSEGGQAYTDYQAYQFSALEGKLIKEYPSFNNAVDEFYSNIEQQKGQKALAQQEKEATQKLEAIRKEQAGRIKVLEELIKGNLVRAQLIDEFPKQVQDAITVILAALDAGMDWTELGHVIADEKQKGNPVALLMLGLKLDKNLVTLALGEDRMSVDVDVRQSPHANATRYYELRKVAIDKLARTKESMDRALRSAERKIRADLRQHRSKAKRQQSFAARRKTLWFEKFHWFVSSDGFLVLAGRDMQQNELLVKRYLRDGDVYVHADMHGAASVIVKGRRCEDISGETPSRFIAIPPRTLSEAGSMSLCHSRAWEAKIVTSAWWVHAAQVSKTAPSGEYLPTGSFMIRGKKNFLPPAPLLYAFGFVFVLDEEGKAKQKTERLARDHQLMEAPELEVEDAEKYMAMLDVGEAAEEQIDVTTNLPKPKQIPREKQGKKQTVKETNDVPKKGSGRGAKGKQKKIAKKYADQDEEERGLRMALLASGKKKPEPQVTKKSSVNKTEKPLNAEKPATSAENPVTAIEPAFDDEEDSVAAVGDDELAVIDSLTGTLRGNYEHSLYAIPVAGPMTALANYTFRVKLAPGSMKRGKAVQQAVSILIGDSKDLDMTTWSTIRGEADSTVDPATMFKRVKEMVRAIPDADLNQTMLGHVKIMASAKDLRKSKTDLKKKKQK